MGVVMPAPPAHAWWVDSIGAMALCSPLSGDGGAGATVGRGVTVGAQSSEGGHCNPSVQSVFGDTVDLKSE